MKVVKAILATALAVSVGQTAVAGVIFAPTSGVINASGPGFGSLSDTFNQNGLLTGYTANVTDFDAYLATNPLHNYIFSGNEWFSNQGSTSATVTYDFGVVRSFDALALWNEEAAGIGSLNLSISSDGVTFASLASGLTPTNHSPAVLSYGADVFGFSAVNAQYVRFDMSQCPQPSAIFTSCSIGEVAFRATEAAVPEPGTLALLGLGLAGLAATRRRKQ